MSLIVHDMEQGTEEWFAIRAGKPTASEFKTVMASGRDGGDSKTRKTYLLKLAGEILTGEPMENYSNGHMERGKEQEANARDRYAMMQDADPMLVGFIEDTEKRCGASPDSLVGDDGLLEIKSAMPHILIEKLLRNDFPPEHRAQCQGALWVAQREWIDIAIHCPRLPLFVKRERRDNEYILKLASAVQAFNDELAETVERVRKYGAPSTLKANLTQSILMAG